MIKPYRYAYEFQKKLINPTLEHMGLYSKAASNLLLGTAMQESCIGRASHVSPTYIYQIGITTANDVYKNYLPYHPELKMKLDQLYDNSHTLYWNTVYNIKFQIALALVIYLRSSKPLPDANDSEALARYWKVHYNTYLGKGKVEEFKNIYDHYFWVGYYRCAF